MKLLSPYRVLDLTDVRGQLAGMLLADLGADVLRIEPPQGSDARRVGPLLEDAPAAERSLSFAAYNRNKRSVVLDLQTARGREAFLELVRGADFVLDSWPPSPLDEPGLDFDALLRANAQLVHVRITPFGSDGPRARAPAADLSIAALGGPVALQGDPDRPPIRLSVPQVWRHAGAEAAIAALVGHARMRTTGCGVCVDVSAQSAMTWTTLQASEAYAIQGRDFERAGSDLQVGAVDVNLAHRCRDGDLVVLGLGSTFVALRKWMLEEGCVDASFGEREDWKTYDRRLLAGEPVEIELPELRQVLEGFFMTRTKRELFETGLQLGVTLAPVQTLDDLLRFEPLKARGFFVDIPLPNGKRVAAPGPFARSSRFEFEPPRPAPRLGQHTEQVLRELREAPRVRTPEPTPEAVAPYPFAGLKVADFSWVGVGPISAKYLADHGADVVRFESQTRGDVLRAAGPHKDNQPGWNRSHFFGEFNSSKRSVTLDLKHARAAEILPSVLRWADVVIESFTPGAAGRLGIGYDAVCSHNPSAIMVSTCLMGQTGPLAGLAGYGYHAAAVAGFTALTGYPDRPPVGPWNAYTDTVAPRFLTATLLAALEHRRRTGEGQCIDLGQMEASLHFLAPEILSRQATGQVYERIANRARDAAPQGVYPCAGEDEWCAIAVESDAQWRALRGALGEPHWARDTGLETLRGRLAAHDALDAGIARWTRAREPREAMQTLLAAGVPAGHVQRSSDLLTDPQLAQRHFHRYLEHGEMGVVPYAGHQFRISAYDNGPRGPAPLIGADNFAFLTEDLGIDPERVALWMACGAIR